jgi:hypothetical protein
MAEWVRSRPRAEELPAWSTIDEYYCYVGSQDFDLILSVQTCKIPTPGRIGLQQHKEGAIHRAVRFGDVRIIGNSANDKIYCNVSGTRA